MTDDVKLEPTAEEIERAAKAICLHAWKNEHMWQDWLNEARAAILAMDRRASPPAPAVAIWQANMENAWAALRMIREAVETFGPITSLDGPDAVLLRGPEPIHEAEAIIEAILRLKPAPAVAVPDIKRLVERLMSYLFGACQPDRGDVFDWMDDHAEEAVRFMLAAAPQPPATRSEEPTKEMIQAGLDDLGWGKLGDPKLDATQEAAVASVYLAMRAVAPPETNLQKMQNAPATRSYEEGRHEFTPNKRYPWFCERCGYGANETLQHAAIRSLADEPRHAE